MFKWLLLQQPSQQLLRLPLLKPEPQIELPGTRTRSPVPAQIGEYFLPATQNLTDAARQRGRSIPLGAEELGIMYRPCIVGPG